MNNFNNIRFNNLKNQFVKKDLIIYTYIYIKSLSYLPIYL
jgi:hypothetical protein